MSIQFFFKPRNIRTTLMRTLVSRLTFTFWSFEPLQYLPKITISFSIAARRRGHLNHPLKQLPGII